MFTLKTIISRYMRRLTSILIVMILTVIVCIQINNEHGQAYEDAMTTFFQIEQLLVQNQEELSEIREEYSRTCLHNAEAIAYMIQNHPEVLENLEELEKIAVFMEVDEIHIFDRSGRIYAGTHPQYYDYTFDSGEQMMFFKPMLEDKSLKLVQEITPNTAEAKMMQYSALWSRNGEFIVQVGMEPVNVMKAAKKNELSFLFSLLRVNPEADYYAVDIESGEVVGSTALECVGKNIAGIGLALNKIKDQEGFHAQINGGRAYCVFKKAGSNYIGRIISSRELYKRVPSVTVMITVCLIMIALILSHAVTRYMNKYVVDGIHSINEKLHMIAGGNLDEIVDSHSSVEFSQLSSYINMMKNSLLNYNEKMSYVLSKTNMYIGVYEYNEYMKRVRFTEYVPRILMLGSVECEKLSSDYKAFKAFIDRLRGHSAADEPGVFELDGRYVKLEESSDGGGVFGVVIDVTDEVQRRKQIENERDIDLLTGLYNRRGIDMRIEKMLRAPEGVGHSALVMVDADNLKTINDTYGHEMGDAYLKEIARLISALDARHCVAARLGGDEFVLFLYQYDEEKMLSDAISRLDDIQTCSHVDLPDGGSVPIRFSFGYRLVEEGIDYQTLLKEADEKMYEYKRERKKRDNKILIPGK